MRTLPLLIVPIVVLIGCNSEEPRLPIEEELAIIALAKATPAEPCPNYTYGELLTRAETAWGSNGKVVSVTAANSKGYSTFKFLLEGSTVSIASVTLTGTTFGSTAEKQREAAWEVLKSFCEKKAAGL